MDKAEVSFRSIFGQIVRALFVGLLLMLGGAMLCVSKVQSHGSFAKAAAARSDVALLAAALHQFRLDYNRYPTNLEGLTALNKAPTELRESWRGPYLPKGPTIDPWGNPYLYRSGPGDKFTLTCLGQDGKPGGDGEAADIVDSE
jgi:general secretion pathway protein G